MNVSFIIKSNYWTNQKANKYAYKLIYEFIENGGSGSHSSIVPLLPFEVFLLNDDFKITRFSELNCYHPERAYQKKNKFISLGYGIDGHKFYFTISNNNNYYLVDNDLLNYKKAINGKLKSLDL